MSNIYPKQIDSFSKNELMELEKFINNCINQSETKDEFTELLKTKGYSIRFGRCSKNITFILPDGRRIRNHYLISYSKQDLSTEGIRKRLNMKSLETLRQAELNNKLFCERNNIKPQNHPYIYVLKCQDNCYYVGYTNRFEKRMKQHFIKCKRVTWTALHPPIEIIKVIDISNTEIDDYNKYETAETIHFMKKYGIENVRGGDFIFEDTNEIIHLLKTHGFEVKNNSLFPTSDSSDVYRNCMLELNGRRVY